MIKTALLITASTTALMLAASGAMAAPAAPASNTDAFMSLSAGADSLAVDGTSLTGPTIEGAASAEYNFTPTLGVQGDVVYRTQDFTVDATTLHEHDFEAALHTFVRNERYLVGIFGQYGEGAVGADSFAIDVTHAFGGVEGQLFLGNATLYGQAGVERYSVGGDDITGWFGNFEARYFLQPNFKVEAHVGAETLSFPGSGFLGQDSETTLNVGVGAEYRLDNSPFSVFAKYDFAQNDLGTGSESPTNNRVLVGVKLNLDAPTLLARDRSGASLKPVDSHAFDFVPLVVVY